MAHSHYLADLVENLFDAVLAHGEQGLTQLQLMQKWHLVKIVQRQITTKLFPHERPYIAIRDSPLIAGSLPRQSSKLGNKSLGSLQLHLHSAYGLGLSFFRQSSHSKQSLWKVLMRYGDQTMETDAQPLSANGSMAGIAVVWPEQDFKFGSIHDLYSDLVIEVYLKREQDASKESIVENEQLSALFGSDVPAADEASSPLNHATQTWTCYGRLAIPMTRLLLFDDYSVGPAWFHLYPPSQQSNETKFLRPCSGYPGLGMSRHKCSRGFVQLSVTFKPKHDSPLALAVMFHSNPPTHVWRLPSKLDLQVFETAGLRMHHHARTLPRWIPIFCHFSAIQEQSFSQQGHALAFWMLLLLTTSLAPLWLTPIAVAGLVFVVSDAYRCLNTPIQPPKSLDKEFSYSKDKGLAEDTFFGMAIGYHRPAK